MKDKITFCIVDDIDTYANSEIQTTIRNISDFTISNIHTKGYKVIKGKEVDKLLRNVDTDYAVVMSPGTEYINGDAFFKALEDLVTTDFFIAGHVLDRTMHDAYYELHHQCYVVNMAVYNAYKSPTVGAFEKDVQHTQLEPTRSLSNIHDDYTPKFVSKGLHRQQYSNRCHGWNFLRLAFENNLPVVVFDDDIRNNKKHFEKKIVFKEKGNEETTIPRIINNHNKVVLKIDIEGDEYKILNDIKKNYFISIQFQNATMPLILFAASLGSA